VFAETEPGVFANTPASELLRGGWGSFAHLFGGIFYRAAGLLDASGEHTFQHELGADFWSWLAEHPGERALFDHAMEQGKERRAARLATIEWHGNETVVDVGGGNGSFLRAVLQPGQHGIVLDLPETVRDAANRRRVPASEITRLSGAEPRHRTAVQKMAQACFDSDDYKEGRRPFMEKRKPAFKGR